MVVKRIVANIATNDIAAAQKFYGQVLQMDRLMDHGWIVTYGTGTKMEVQISIATQEGMTQQHPIYPLKLKTWTAPIKI